MTYNSMPPNAGTTPVNGTLILVLGILSIVLCQILGPVAWVMGNNAMATLNAGGGDASQRGLVNAGRICGIVGTAFLILGVLYWVIIVAIMGGSIASGGLKPTPNP